MKYFAHCFTLDEAREHYRRLAFVYHPDRAGNNAQWNDIAQEWNEFQIVAKWIPHLVPHVLARYMPQHAPQHAHKQPEQRNTAWEIIEQLTRPERLRAIQNIATPLIGLADKLFTEEQKREEKKTPVVD